MSARAWSQSRTVARDLVGTARECRRDGQYNSTYKTLDDYRVQLETAEKRSTASSTVAIAANARNVGTLTGAAQRGAPAAVRYPGAHLSLDNTGRAIAAAPFSKAHRSARCREQRLGLSAPRDPLSRLLLAPSSVCCSASRPPRSSTARAKPSTASRRSRPRPCLPVIAEVPYINAIGKRRYDVLTQVVPVIAGRRGVSRAAHDDLDDVDREHRPGRRWTPAERSDIPKVLMVASPGPSEGKSTSTANLAACYAETGKRVIVIDLDQRRQKLHRFVGAEPEPHLENLGSVERAARRPRLAPPGHRDPRRAVHQQPGARHPPGESVAAIQAAIAWARGQRRHHPSRHAAAAAHQRRLRPHERGRRAGAAHPRRPHEARRGLACHADAAPPRRAGARRVP